MAAKPQFMILRRSFILSVVRRVIALIVIAGLIYGLVAGIYATRTIFKVKMNYAVVLEKFGRASARRSQMSAGTPAGLSSPG